MKLGTYREKTASLGGFSSFSGASPGFVQEILCAAAARGAAAWRELHE
jgi:hypothetical protein